MDRLQISTEFVDEFNRVLNKVQSIYSEYEKNHDVSPSSQTKLIEEVDTMIKRANFIDHIYPEILETLKDFGKIVFRFIKGKVGVEELAFKTKAIDKELIMILKSKKD
ncbi:MAG: hypothetical protein CMH63_02300 [Nanoarchaeota archaeon]|jgi:predicted transcriptional regulator|nr:hypothetical protein [Nanoarchaeota archaeon]|tara:strand:+ start:12508 stop:12831 length:324 start_codon:yes stop_codon:yes gene_type:complete